MAALVGDESSLSGGGELDSVLVGNHIVMTAMELSEAQIDRALLGFDTTLEVLHAW